MSVTIKSEREIELIRKSCHIIAKIHQDLGKELKQECPPWKLTAWQKT